MIDTEQIKIGPIPAIIWARPLNVWSLQFTETCPTKPTP